MAANLNHEPTWVRLQSDGKIGGAVSLQHYAGHSGNRLGDPDSSQQGARDLDSLARKLRRQRRVVKIQIDSFRLYIESAADFFRF